MSEISRLSEGRSEYGTVVHAARWVRVRNAGGFYSLCGVRAYVPVPSKPVLDGGVDCKHCQRALRAMGLDAVAEGSRILAAYDR